MKTPHLINSFLAVTLLVIACEKQNTPMTSPNSTNQKTTNGIIGPLPPPVFAAAGNGYVLNGKPDNTQYNYQYSPAANAWTKKTPLPALFRTGSASITIDDKGYVGSGIYGSTEKFADWWQYDPSADAWTRKANYPGKTAYGATAFASDNGTGDKGYLAGGVDNAGNYRKECWQYDPATDQWTQKASMFAAVAWGVGMNTSAAGYVATGYNGTNTLATVLRYDFVANTWGSEPNIPYASPIIGLNGSRYAAFGFGIGNTIYIGGGESTQGEPTSARSDFWSLAVPE